MFTNHRHMDFTSIASLSIYISLCPTVVDLNLNQVTIMFRRKHNSQEQQGNQAVQEQKVKDLRAVIGPLSGRSSLFCNNACLRRYLEARNWNVDKSKKMLEETLKWRATFKPEEIRWHQVATEGETGKAYRADFHDREGRTVIVMRPAKQNTSSHEDQLRYLVYLLEDVIINLPDGQEQMIWLIDFTGWSLANSVPIKTTRETAHVLQSHYPERLAVAFLYDPPRIFESLWKIIKYFLDPKTFQKVKFVYPKNEESVTLMAKNFDLKMLPEEFGGKNIAQYVHEEFTKLTAEDDIKMAALWGLDEKSLLGHHPMHGNSASGVAPAPGHFTAQAS
ncbi:phosphatidylinositol transfer protein 3-like [Zingiber officinale]|uniref:phosphatidylinositol transfer protein 3-like n=1 Tax=Zingiber officinale TaxID=94328 RepID=UPI001C4D0ED7|nr:phosphatidylinositol transfer protein 3-like [Zingiber officinale]